MSRTPSALSVYLIAAGFRPPLPSPESFARQTGERLWLHVANADAARTVPTLIARLSEARGEEADVVMSGNVGAAHDIGAVTTNLPRERATDIRRVLAEEEPAVALFLGLEIAPAFLYGLRESGVRTLLVAGTSGNSVRAQGRLLSRSAFRLFDQIAATNEAARASLIKLGAPPHRIQVIGRLDDSPQAPTADIAQQERMAQILAGRPLWLAANLTLAEMRAVLDAQRQANGLSHRLLLVVAPSDPSEAEPIAAAAELRGYSVARRSAGEDPEEHIQIYLADEPGEIGLWYRLAPITFMGGSLVAPGCDAGPDAPAALGSAILYGPEIGARRAAFDHLATVGGASLVTSGKTLGAAVSGLLSPDKTAAMAHAAWLETSKGAEGTDRVVDMLVEAFDAPESL